VLGLLCSLFIAPAFFAPAPPALASPPPTTSVGDAYATGTGCDWIFGTSGVEQTVAYTSGAGTYELLRVRHRDDAKRRQLAREDIGHLTREATSPEGFGMRPSRSAGSRGSRGSIRVGRDRSEQSEFEFLEATRLAARRANVRGCNRESTA
jgi:hypothetical protein